MTFGPTKHDHDPTQDDDPEAESHPLIQEVAQTSSRLQAAALSKI